MKAENSIEVLDVCKHFRVYKDKGATLKEKLLFSSRRAYEDRKVLDGISFEAKIGEAIGLIGHNGCGKSTTLKLLTRIMYPDSGKIEMCGRISSLIELGAGFHPDMSGRENIYINASIFGLTKKEIDKRVNDIIEFSELSEFLDNPVRTYSSGMYMRLAFAVAINVDADILLIDEILAVGDATFQTKCFNKLREIKAKGTTIIIVSHSLSQIEQICDKCIWIDGGKIRMQGRPDNVDMAYLDYMGKKSIKAEEKKNTAAQISDIEEKAIEILGAEIIHEDKSKDTRFYVGESAMLSVYYKADKNMISKINDNLHFGFKIYRNDNINAFSTNTMNERIDFKIKDDGWIECYFPELNLIAGEYMIDLLIRSNDMFIYDYKTAIIKFETYSSVLEEGIAHLKHEWKY